MKNILVLMILSGSLFLMGCDKNNLVQPGFDRSFIIKVEGPASGSAGTEIDLEVTLQGYNSCAVAGQLEESNYANTRLIMGKVIYQGEACFQALVPVVETYTFKATRPGVYNLKFVTVNNTFINHTITVIN